MRFSLPVSRVSVLLCEGRHMFGVKERDLMDTSTFGVWKKMGSGLWGFWCSDAVVRMDCFGDAKRSFQAFIHA